MKVYRPLTSAANLPLTADVDLGPPAAELIARHVLAERVLVADVFADPHRLLPIADACGIETGTFQGEDHRALWCALLWAFNSGRLRGEDAEADRLALALLVRRALDIAGAWHEVSLRQSATSSLWDAEKVAAELFDGAFPSETLTRDAARQLLRLHRRLAAAREHFDSARRALECDDAMPETPAAAGKQAVYVMPLSRRRVVA